MDSNNNNTNTNREKYHNNLAEKDQVLLNLGLLIFGLLLALTFTVFVLPSWYDYNVRVVDNNNWLILPAIIVALVISLVCGIGIYLQSIDYLRIKREIKIYEKEHQDNGN